MKDECIVTYLSSLQSSLPGLFLASVIPGNSFFHESLEYSVGRAQSGILRAGDDEMIKRVVEYRLSSGRTTTSFFPSVRRASSYETMNMNAQDVLPKCSDCRQVQHLRDYFFDTCNFSMDHDK